MKYITIARQLREAKEEKRINQEHLKTIFGTGDQDGKGGEEGEVL